MPGTFDTHAPDTDNWDAEPNAAAAEIWLGKAGTSRNRSSHRRRAACEPPQAIMVIWMIFFWMAYCTSCALL